MFLLRFSLIAFFFLISTHAYPTLAQVQGNLRGNTEPFQVTGQVRYVNGNPANDVLVHLETLTGGYVGDVRTDRLGKFRFQSLLPIQYQLTIRIPGFKEINHEVNLVMVSSENLQFQLVADPPARPAASKTILDANVPAEARKEFEKAEVALDTLKKERIPEGVQHLEKAISLYPNFLEAQLKLGVAYMDLQRWDKAEQELRRALDINPKTANALFALGEIYWRQKKYGEAESVLREGLSVEDRSWQGRFTLGRVYWSKGEITKAARQVAIALQLNPNLAEAHLLAGDILLRGNKRDDALAEFQEYLRLAPNGEYAQQVRTAVEKLKK